MLTSVTGSTAVEVRVLSSQMDVEASKKSINELEQARTELKKQLNDAKNYKLAEIAFWNQKFEAAKKAADEKSDHVARMETMVKVLVGAVEKTLVRHDNTIEQHSTQIAILKDDVMKQATEFSAYIAAEEHKTDLILIVGQAQLQGRSNISAAEERLKKAEDRLDGVDEGKNEGVKSMVVEVVDVKLAEAKKTAEERLKKAEDRLDGVDRGKNEGVKSMVVEVVDVKLAEANLAQDLHRLGKAVGGLGVGVVEQSAASMAGIGMDTSLEMERVDALFKQVAEIRGLMAPCPVTSEHITVPSDLSLRLDAAVLLVAQSAVDQKGVCVLTLKVINEGRLATSEEGMAGFDEKMAQAAVEKVEEKWREVGESGGVEARTTLATWISGSEGLVGPSQDGFALRERLAAVSARIRGPEPEGLVDEADRAAGGKENVAPPSPNAHKRKASDGDLNGSVRRVKSGAKCNLLTPELVMPALNMIGNANSASGPSKYDEVATVFGDANTQVLRGKQQVPRGGWQALAKALDPGNSDINLAGTLMGRYRALKKKSAAADAAR